MTTRIVLTGTIIDEETAYTAHEICNNCHTTIDKLRALVAEGVINPSGDSPETWCFGHADIRRIRTVIRLQRDLRINLAGCALVVELLEEVEALRLTHQRSSRPW